MNMCFLKFYTKTLPPLKKFDILLITREKKIMIESDRSSRRVRLKRSQSLRRSTYSVQIRAVRDRQTFRLDE